MSVNSKPFILSPVSSPSEYSPPTAITPLPIATLAPIPLELEPPVKEPSTAVPPTLIKSSEKDYIALDDYFSIDLDTSFESFSVNDRDPTYFSDSSIEIVKHSISDRTRAKTNDSIIKLETDNHTPTLENFFTISIKHNGHSYRITRDVVIHDLENRKPNDALKVFYLHARSFGAVNNRMLIKTLSKFFKNKWVLYQGCFKDTTRFSGFYVLKFENPPKYMMKILFIDTDEASTKYNQQVLRVNESFFCAYHGSHSDNICQHTIKLYDSQDKVE
ncbi:uncharacterized protein SAPINGB_P000478 [Magnusiomyces paraingens]|uniref:Uncharacterized protein n=1 Tax=Magnusiomyces paraingens TaxID=2606893 RepID=A0A5E8AZI1_9ASCO|nr:uncharacterized protein SAPINGB_P000478 [Saprochaete ingens]VVT44624.1 unnamed protein product [Saprochaete ingens]